MAQGTVLACILFMIKLSDMDKEGKGITVRCCGDDSRVIIMIGLEDNKEKYKKT